MAKLPIRYEIRSFGSGGANTMKMMCGTVISEGGFLPISNTFSHVNENSYKVVNTSIQPIISLKLR